MGRRWRRAQDGQLSTGTEAAGGFVREVIEGRNVGMFIAAGWCLPRSQLQIVGTPYHRTEAHAKSAVERWLSRRSRKPSEGRR